MRGPGGVASVGVYTGDAGVAIYMVMALVTLAGAAVLVSKKRAFN